MNPRQQSPGRTVPRAANRGPGTGAALLRPKRPGVNKHTANSGLPFAPPVPRWFPMLSAGHGFSRAESIATHTALAAEGRRHPLAC
jgi:hypothetical protein